MSNNKNFFQQQGSESSPLIGQTESCEEILRRFRHTYRFHLGGAWILAVLTTATVTYFLNYQKVADPNACTSDRSRTTAIVLSVFFGPAGADRFYLGYPITGAAKLLTGGLAGLWWTVDIVLLAMGVLGDANGCTLH